MDDKESKKIIFENLRKVKNKVAILSGKGGVGKSTVCVQLAQSLFRKGFKVGILDIDLCGPSIPRLLGVEDAEVHISDDGKGFVPIIVNEKGLYCISIANLLNNKDDAVIWRGPRKHGMIKKFLSEVYWGELDYLLIDTPPGTSDEHISIFSLLNSEQAKPCYSVIVTQPQKISVIDVKKEITFCSKLNIPILGVVENMSGFKCPCCSEVYYIFSKGGGKELAKELNLEFLGDLPIDQKLSIAEDKGDTDFLEKNKDSIVVKKLTEIADKIVEFLKKESNVKKE